MSFPILSFLIFVPLAGAMLLLFVENRDDRRDRLIRVGTLAVSLVVLGLAVVLWARFDATSAQYQFVERHDWIASLGVQYHFGIDGIEIGQRHRTVRFHSRAKALQAIHRLTVTLHFVFGAVSLRIALEVPEEADGARLDQAGPVSGARAGSSRKKTWMTLYQG